MRIPKSLAVFANSPAPLGLESIINGTERPEFLSEIAVRYASSLLVTTTVLSPIETP